MPKQNESPYVSHGFVCTNDRGGERKSCADNNSQLIKSKLKDAVNEKGWKGKVRISTSGCMGALRQGLQFDDLPSEGMGFRSFS